VIRVVVQTVAFEDPPKKKETNMGKINLGRVLLGGLVAGLILSIGEYVLNDIVLAVHFVVIAVVMTFLLGIVLVWVYALIRSRRGPGPKTAILAALIMWFGVYLYTGVINGTLLRIPMNVILIGFAWGLVEYIAAALAGAALYQEG
jgi:uncharacterized membrane protein YdcZ (DUF606 family)